MSEPRTVADVQRRHVTPVVEGIDRMYLNVYQPQLPCEGQVAAFFRHRRGHTFASSALMDAMTKAFIASVEDFTRRHQLPLIALAKGQRKKDVALEYRAKLKGSEGILFVGKAQEKTPVFRTEKRRNPRTGQTYPWIVRPTAMVNQFYFYGIDEDFGPSFLKFCTYFPYKTPSSVSTATSTSNASWPRKASPSRPSTTASSPAPTPGVCSSCATVCPAPGSTPCCGSGWRAGRTPSPTGIARPATATTCPSSRPSSP